MKKLRTILGRTIWVVDPLQLNPDGRSMWEGYQGLAKRYHFSKSPQHLMDLNNNNALEFTSGTFNKGKRLDLRVGLTIYNNAIVGDTLSSTDDAELFLQDAAAWVAKEHGILVESAVVRKTYSSHLEVKADANLSFANPKLNFVTNRLNSLATSVDEKVVSFGLSGILYWSEDMGSSHGQVFRIEHKYETKFTDNVYFSAAPLQTQEHLALLQDIENALKA